MRTKRACFIGMRYHNVIVEERAAIRNTVHH